ncbi:MAG: type II secretion system F family protein [Nanoarchaeota archaeon]
MKFKIPFTFSDIEKIKTRTKFLRLPLKPKSDTKLNAYLINSDLDLTREEYISICFKYALGYFTSLFIVLSTILLIAVPNAAFLGMIGISFLISLIFGIFVYSTQVNYPRLYSSRKQRNIEKNLIPGLEDMLVQLNSGIPLFNIMVNISAADYESLSLEFKKAVKNINAGYAQEEVLEDIGDKNPSIFFRRTLWQISNGMRAGSNIATIIRESIKSLRQDQLLQMQTYGNRLNPLFMFYMLMAVIIPALSITFLTVIASMVSLSAATSKLMFAAVFLFVVFIQIMFLGIMKSLRPSLL